MAYLKNMTQEAKVELFKELVADLDLEALKDTEPEFKLVPLSVSLEPARERMSHPDRLDGLSTGYHRLDRMIGGFAPGEMITLSGGTGRGKTLFSQCIMANMSLNNVPILFFTLEMPQVDTTIRFIKMMPSMDSGDILGDLPITYFEGDKVDIHTLDLAIKKGVANGVKIVFIDHIHFFAKTNQNQAVEIGNIAREVKLMALKYNIPIILIAHIRKLLSPGKMPGIDDIKDSSGIAQDSDTILMVNRNMNTSEETMKRTLRVRVLKSRRVGELGNCQFLLDSNSYLQEQDYLGDLDEL